MNRRSPSSQRALEYIQKMITTLQTDRLPAITVMSRDAKVAPATMWKVLQTFKRQNRISAAPKRGIFLKKRGNNQEYAPASEHDSVTIIVPRWQKIATLIRQKILAGDWKDGTILPSFKTMKGMWGSSFLTIRKALDTCVLEKYLVETGRHYAVSRPGNKPINSSLLFIAGVDNRHHLLHVTNRSPEFWSVLERHVASRNLVLHTIDCDTAVRVLQRSSAEFSSTLAPGTLAGVILYTVSLSIETRHELLTLLKKINIPVAVVDEDTATPVFGDLSDTRRIRFFELATDNRPGMSVGKFLLEKGHCNVAYFSIYARQEWAIKRLEGIRHAFSRSGLQCRVYSFLKEDLSTSEDIHASIRRRIDYFKLEQCAHRLHEALKPHDLLLQDVLTPSFFINKTVQEVIKNEYEDLFTEALKCRDITAWVGCEDGHAIHALSFLKKNNIPVPGRISVLGFDDTTAALENGLTSYNFNVGGCIFAVIDHILNCRTHTTGAYDEQPSSATGMVIQRKESVKSLFTPNNNLRIYDNSVAQSMVTTKILRSRFRA